MAANRLLKALGQINPDQAEQIYGSEFAFDLPNRLGSTSPIKRVAIFAESFLPKVDGVSKTAYLTTRYLQETGREVLVFAPDIAPTQIGPSKVVPMPSFGFKVAPETRVALPNLMINQHLDAFQPDLIHLFSPALLSVSGMLAGRRRHIPVIANYQTDIPAYANHYGLSVFSRPSRDWLRFIHNGCHLTLVPSNYTLNQLQKSGYKRLRRWGRGVNTTGFGPQHRSDRWRERLLNGRDPSAVVVIYVGRLANEKRIDLLLEVAQTPGVALTIIGDGALRGELEAQFAGTRTHFMGYLFGDDLAQAYASADVFMFPSPSETFGQVVQEAMASGLPAIVINQGGVVDLVQDGETGYICEADTASFAAAVRRLRDNPDMRQRMAYQARCYAEAHPWSAIMAQLEGYYAEALRMSQRAVRAQSNHKFVLPIKI
ncbi:MAG: glycosyltransferase family 1 protein [Anaerolineae bacterium]|nr:glycosyltransferase family 1 protein [Anaerolineae bacterium]